VIVIGAVGSSEPVVRSNSPAPTMIVGFAPTVPVLLARATASRKVGQEYGPGPDNGVQFDAEPVLISGAGAWTLIVVADALAGNARATTNPNRTHLGPMIAGPQVFA